MTNHAQPARSCDSCDELKYQIEVAHSSARIGWRKSTGRPWKSRYVGWKPVFGMENPYIS